MPEVVKLLEFAGSLSAIVLVLLTVAALTMPWANEWVKSRFASGLELEKARLDLASDYYKRRLETYLRIWKDTQDAIRAVLNAANPRRRDDWLKAREAVDDLKNTYWDNRPLLSSRVHVCVRRVSSFFDRAIAQPGPSATTADEQGNQFRGLVREVKAIQGALLIALADDLQHAGLSAMIVGAPGEDAGEPPVNTDVDSAVTRLVCFVGRGQLRLPYVGKGLLIKTFQTLPSLDLDTLIGFCVEDGLLEEYEAYDADRHTGAPALRVNAGSAEALEMLDEDVRRCLCGPQ
jgi:hypothetical protein